MESAVTKNRKIRVEAIFSNTFDLNTYEHIIENSICAVIDTLMAVSTIAAIFGSNCKRVVLSREKMEAYELKKIFKDYLLCGEEDGIPPEGFNYGNLPLNFVKLDLSNIKIILSTTNGSASFFKLLSSEFVFALSLLNLDHCLRVILDLALNHEKNILLLCSGRKGYPTYDDIYTAGLAIKHLSMLIDLEVSDSAKVALEIANNNCDSVLDAISNSESGQIVRRLGYLDDLEYCSRINVYKIIPRLRVQELNNEKDIKFLKEYKDIYDFLLKFNKKYFFNKLLFLEPYNNNCETKL
jgi:2-phosphosulfolactate phosphatase